MTEQKFDPVKEFINLRDSISKSIGQSLKNATGITPDFPAVDIYETEDSLVVYTEPLLGIVPSSVEVSMEKDVLTFAGETIPDQDIPKTAFLRRELKFGAFVRSLVIPRPVIADKASASLKKGVLTITLPKAQTGTEQIINVTPAE